MIRSGTPGLDACGFSGDEKEYFETQKTLVKTLPSNSHTEGTAPLAQ